MRQAIEGVLWMRTTQALLQGSVALECGAAWRGSLDDLAHLVAC